MEGEPVTDLLLIPLDDLVVFPNMSATLTVDVGDEERVLLVPRHEDRFAKVGTVAEDDGSVADEYRTKIEEAGMPDEVREVAEKELGRLERMGEQSAETSVIRTYLDWLVAVPWSKRSDERLDPEHAREVLDADHAGLEDVKDRIVEYIAVKKLRVERGIQEDK